MTHWPEVSWFSSKIWPSDDAKPSVLAEVCVVGNEADVLHGFQAGVSGLFQNQFLLLLSRLTSPGNNLGLDVGNGSLLSSHGESNKAVYTPGMDTKLVNLFLLLIQATYHWFVGVSMTKVAGELDSPYSSDALGSRFEPRSISTCTTSLSRRPPPFWWK